MCNFARNVTKRQFQYRTAAYCKVLMNHYLQYQCLLYEMAGHHAIHSPACGVAYVDRSSITGSLIYHEKNLAILHNFVFNFLTRVKKQTNKRALRARLPDFFVETLIVSTLNIIAP